MKHKLEYYTEKIKNNEEWEFTKVFVYGDKSGTQTNSRDEFNKIIKMCERWKIDLVITKSISKFERNTVDAL